MGVGDRRVRPGELAGNRARRVDMRGPVAVGAGAVKPLLIRCLEFRELQHYTAGDARPQTSAVAPVEWTAKTHAAAALAYVAGPHRFQLMCEQIGKAARRGGEELLIVACGHACSAQVDPGGLELRVLVKGMQGFIAPEAGLFVAAERHGDVVGIVAIDVNHAIPRCGRNPSRSCWRCADAAHGCPRRAALRKSRGSTPTAPPFAAKCSPPPRRSGSSALPCGRAAYRPAPPESPRRWRACPGGPSRNRF